MRNVVGTILVAVAVVGLARVNGLGGEADGPAAVRLMRQGKKGKGTMQGIPAAYKPAQDNPALRNLDWWMDGELDGLFGEPTPEEKQTRTDLISTGPQ